MPFTPMHMGPGIVFKAAIQSRFSLMVFGWSQIVTDLQPLYRILTHRGELHGFSHTYLGATLIALVSAISGKYLGEIGLRLFRLPKFLPITWPAAFIGAFIGTYSHVFLDSVMHSDVKPFAPWSTASPGLDLVSIEALHVFCLVTAVLGGAAYFLLANRHSQVPGDPA